jgi:hypothetical protein
VNRNAVGILGHCVNYENSRYFSSMHKFFRISVKEESVSPCSLFRGLAKWTG